MEMGEQRRRGCRTLTFVNNIPNWCVRTSSSCSQSGALSTQREQTGAYVSCDGLQKRHVVVCVLWHCLSSPSPRSVSGLLLHGRRSLSRGGIGGHDWQLASLFVNSICVHVTSVSASWLSVQIWVAQACNSAHEHQTSFLFLFHVNFTFLLERHTDTHTPAPPHLHMHISTAPLNSSGISQAPQLRTSVKLEKVCELKNES